MLVVSWPFALAIFLLPAPPATAGRAISKDSGPCDLKDAIDEDSVLPSPLDMTKFIVENLGLSLDSDKARSTFAVLMGFSTDYASLDEIREIVKI